MSIFNIISTQQPQSIQCLEATIAANPKIHKEMRMLDELISFSTSPTWTNYRLLPIRSMYLIAGRFCEPQSFFWNFKSRYTLMKEFDKQFKAKPTSLMVHKAIQEAIQIQKKIITIKTIQIALENKMNPNVLPNIDSGIYNDLRYSFEKNNFPLNESNFADQVLARFRTEKHAIQSNFKSALHNLKSAQMVC